MERQDFFEGIAHVEVPWGERLLHVPVFYHDFMTMSAQFLAPLERVRAWLPSRRMHPLRVTPWHGVVNIVTFEYRKSDVGAYNEISISIPFSLDRPSPLFVGTLRKGPEVPKVYIRYLPVTTEIARDVGVEFAAYPKFLADITFEEEGDWLRCQLGQDGQHILTLACRTGEAFSVPRYRSHIFNVREGHMLRCEMILSERQMAVSKNPVDVLLDLGDHPIAQELRELGIVRAVGCQYAPQLQAVLTPVIESLPV
jgi:hypothetical protein